MESVCFIVASHENLRRLHRITQHNSVNIHLKEKYFEPKYREVYAQYGRSVNVKVLEMIKRK
jgi:hypothetical protein